jgi:hypothetical protein
MDRAVFIILKTGLTNNSPSLLYFIFQNEKSRIDVTPLLFSDRPYARIYKIVIRPWGPLNTLGQRVKTRRGDHQGYESFHMLLFQMNTPSIQSQM